MSNANPELIKEKKCFKCGHDRFHNKRALKCAKCGSSPTKLVATKDKNKKEYMKIVEDRK